MRSWPVAPVAVLRRTCRPHFGVYGTSEVLDKDDCSQSIYASHSAVSRQAGNCAGSAFLIRSPERHSSELANWDVDENSQLSQFLCAFHKDFDALDG